MRSVNIINIHLPFVPETRMHILHHSSPNTLFSLILAVSGSSPYRLTVKKTVSVIATSKDTTLRSVLRQQCTDDNVGRVVLESPLGTGGDCLLVSHTCVMPHGASAAAPANRPGHMQDVPFSAFDADSASPYRTSNNAPQDARLRASSYCAYSCPHSLNTATLVISFILPLLMFFPSVINIHRYYHNDISNVN